MGTPERNDAYASKEVYFQTRQWHKDSPSPESESVRGDMSFRVNLPMDRLDHDFNKGTLTLEEYRKMNGTN